MKAVLIGYALILMWLVCGCTMIRVPVGERSVTYIRLMEKRTVLLKDPISGDLILLSTSDGGSEALKEIATGIAAGVIK